VTSRMMLALSASRRNDAPGSVSVCVFVGVSVLRDDPARCLHGRKNRREQGRHRESASGRLHRMRILQVRTPRAGKARRRRPRCIATMAIATKGNSVLTTCSDLPFIPSFHFSIIFLLFFSFFSSQTRSSFKGKERGFCCRASNHCATSRSR